MTAYLDYPAPNYWVSDFNLPGGVSWSLGWLGLAMGMLLLVIATAKFAVLAFHEGRIQFSIPQLVVFCCWMTALFVIINSFSQNQGTNNYFSHFAAYFFEFWSFAFIYTALLIMALYFREVASLTTAGAGKFELLKIPMLVLAIGLWVMTIITSAFNATPNGTTGNTPQDVYNAIFAVYVILSAALVAAYLWGSISLLMTLRGANASVKRAVIIVVVVSSFAMVNAIWTCLVHAALTFYIDGYGGPWGERITFFEWGWILQLTVYLGTSIPGILLCLLFRVSVQKEIELSKSGTSSTSSGYGKSNSSSSSSSSADPVIEL